MCVLKLEHHMCIFRANHALGIGMMIDLISVC